MNTETKEELLQIAVITGDPGPDHKALPYRRYYLSEQGHALLESPHKKAMERGLYLDAMKRKFPKPNITSL